MEEDLAKVEAVLDWADENEDFDTSFIVSLHERLSSDRELTGPQSDALDNIIEKWGIEV